MATIIKGNVDLVTTNKISGWAMYIPSPEKKCDISIRLNNKEIYITKADLAREDLKSLGVGTDKFAFSITLEKNIPTESLKNIEIFVSVNKGNENFYEIKLPLGKNTIRTSNAVRAGYQSFDGDKGDSNSPEKLKRLRLPSLKGKSVLDIGCNEGFFCNYALKQGANNVIGIDSNKDVIEFAKQRVPNAKFINTTWWNLPDEKFDVILFLSAIHYEKNQQKLLTYLKQHLTDNGVLILECGIYQDSSKYWTMIQRHDGVLRYPSFDYITNTLLNGFAVSIMGRSVDQSGDPIPRYVFHCSILRPTVLFIYGPSGSGKTILSKRLEKGQIPIYAIDSLFNRIINGVNIPKSKICEFIKSNGDVFLLDNLSSQIMKSGLTKDLVNLIIEELPLEAGTLIIEGEILIHDEFRNLLAKSIESRGGIIWNVNRH